MGHDNGSVRQAAVADHDELKYLREEIKLVEGLRGENRKLREILRLSSFPLEAIFRGQREPVTSDLIFLIRTALSERAK